MSEQQFTDFFDPEIQKIVSEDGCSIYRMKNVTGEGVITRYEILPGIELFYNDFHMSDGQNQNKLPHSDVLEINHCREGRFECEFANGDYQYISNEQMSYVTNADAGCGLIKYGSALVPFVNRFPKDTQLYKLMTTKPGEGVFGGRGKEEIA